MKDIRNTQGRSEERVEGTYQIIELVFVLFFTTILTYSVINLLT